MEDKLIGTDTLQAYLDTGYTPEQVKDMVFLYREKCQEVSRLRSELQVLKERDTSIVPVTNSMFYACPTCGSTRSIRQKHDFCHDCGQRLKWEE